METAVWFPTFQSAQRFHYIKGLHYNALGLRNEKYFRGKKMSLSLVLPCYNVMKYLPKCLDSIFKNDCNDIEIILVNDGSSDDIGGGLSQYFNKDNCDHNIEFEYKDARIKIIHTCNSGVSAARNTGIENATSDYIVFIDPDDTVKENYFSTISRNYINSRPCLQSRSIPGLVLQCSP